MSGAINQSGPIVPGHTPVFVENGVVQDGGPASGGLLSEIGITNNGAQALGINSGPTTGPYIGYGVTVSSNGTIAISIGGFNGAPAAVLDYIINGVTYAFNPAGNGNITGPVSSVNGDLVAFNGVGGNLVEDSGVPAANVVQGPTIAVSGDIALFNGTTGKLIEDSGVPISSIAGFVQGPTISVSGDVALFNGVTGKLIEDSGIAATTLVTGAAGTTISAAMKPVVGVATLDLGRQALGVNVAYEVLMIPQQPRTNPATWLVYKPDGTLLSTAGTVTNGLQEAINYACEFGYNLHIVGGPTAAGNWPPPFTPNTTPGTNYCVLNYAAQILVPAIEGGRWLFDGVTFNYTGPSSEVTWVWDGTEVFLLESQGSQWVANTSNIIMTWMPTNPWPQDPFGPATGSVVFRMGAFQQIGSGVCCRLDATNGPCFNGKYEFSELNGGTAGLQLLGATHGVVNNKISITLAHVNSSYAVQIGMSSADASTVTGNIFDLICTDPAPNCVGVDIWGSNNNVRGSVTTGSNPYLVGLKLESTATGNHCDFAQLQGTTPLDDLAGVTANNWVNPRGVNQFNAATTVIYSPTGVIEQTISNAASSSGGVATAFPIPFPTQVDSCVASPNNGVAYEEVFANAGTVTITVNAGTPTFFVYARGH